MFAHSCRLTRARPHRTLSGNVLIRIQSGLFRRLTLLQALYIDSNMISIVDADAFAGLSSVQTVYDTTAVCAQTGLTRAQTHTAT